jgi:hypothetical protein
MIKTVAIGKNVNKGKETVYMYPHNNPLTTTVIDTT